MSLKDAIERNRATQAAKRNAADAQTERFRREAGERWAAEDRKTVHESVARLALVLAMPEMEAFIARVEECIARDSVDYNVTGEAYDYVRMFARCYRGAQRAAADVSETLITTEVSR